MSQYTQNSACDFAEELVSFLYDELNGAEKSYFVRHLEKCIFCQTELNEFSLTRNSIQDWKSTEFLPLSIPEISIPYEVQIKTDRQTWFESLQDFFRFSPSLTVGATSLATLALICGLLFVLNNFDTGNNKFAELEKSKISEVTAAPGDNRNVNVITENSEPKNQSVIDLSNDKENNEKPEVLSKINAEAKKPIVTVNNTKIQKPTFKTVAVKAKPSVKQQIKTQKSKAPALIETDEEEEALTLTDLLDQIGGD